MGMSVVIVEGRPLRGWHGRIHRARARLGHSHLTDQAALALHRDVRVALADFWREQGETEHSAVAAYRDVARRLAMLDAPDDLVHRSLLAAEQSAEACERCFELAGRYLGRSMQPGRLRRPLRLPRSRINELCSIAVDTLRDGVLQEAYASRMAAARAARATDLRAADALRSMARDGATHAAKARDVLAWCLDNGGAHVRAAVRAAVLELPDRGPGLVLPLGVEQRRLADHGQFDADPDQAVFRELVGAVREVYLARTQH
ncbi:MAG: hypothetical protein RL238_1812 [Actinomycetota bacterium]